MSILEWQWSTTDWALIIITVVILLYYLGTRTHSHFPKRNIPHRKPVPFFGNMAKSILKGKSFPYQVLEFYNEMKHHQYAGFYMFQVPLIMINDPELIKTIAVKDFEYFTDHRTFFTEVPGDSAIFAKGLFSLKGQRWRDMRSKLTPSFTSSKMKTMFGLMSDCCKQMVDFLEERQHNSDPGCNITKENNVLVLELKEFFTRYANDVIATTAFGVSVDSLKQPKNKFFMMGQEATNMGSWRFFAFFTIPKIMEFLGIGLVSEHVTKFFRSLVVDTMKTREKLGIVRPDMLQLLMEAKKNSLQDANTNGNKKPLDEDDIVAQAVLFFLAGFDTVSTLMCFTCFMLTTHPEVHQKLQDEIDRTFEENNGKFTYELLNNMKYLDMVVSETLRIYPPNESVDRICVRKYTLKADPPLELHPGDNLLIPILGLHRDPKYYPEPENFDPERFSDENKHKINPSTYLPFGVGPRSCIGNRFALMETKMAMVHMLSKFNIKTVNKTPKSINIIQKGINISITGGFWMGLESRNA